ncbi:MAG: UPF0179 family protein [Thermoplasmata archaeon]
MVTIALVGKRNAKVGFEFQYLGLSQECRECPLKNVCGSLEQGKIYRIKNIREKEHPCKIHDFNSVVTVEVEELPVELLIPKKIAVEGTIFTYEGLKCDRYSCRYFNMCNIMGLKPGTRLRIEKVLENVDCPDGRQLSRVLVRW